MYQQLAQPCKLYQPQPAALLQAPACSIMRGHVSCNLKNPLRQKSLLSPFTWQRPCRQGCAALRNTSNSKQSRIVNIPGNVTAKLDAENLSVDRLFDNPATLQKGFVGAVSVVKTPERGHGLATTKAAFAGDLLLMSPPLSFVWEGSHSTQGIGHKHSSARSSGRGCSIGEANTEEEGQGDLTDGSSSGDHEEPEVQLSAIEALCLQMRSQRYSASEVRWLEALAAATQRRLQAPSPPSTAPAPPASAAPTAAAPGLAPGAATANPDTTLPQLGSTFIKKGAPKDVPLPPSLSGNPPLLQAMVESHAFQAATEDADLAMASGLAPREEVLGLWPEFSMLNHSCVPSTVSYVHRGSLITRVSRRSVPEGGELYTNYLGDLVMAPLRVRQQALRAVYGFDCACPRCRGEARLGKEMTQLVENIYEACIEQVDVELAAAIEAQDHQMLEGLLQQLGMFLELLDAAFEKQQVSDRTRIWVQASVSRLYEAMYCCLAALGSTDIQLSELLQSIAGAIQPGSDLHCFWSRTHLASVLMAAYEGAGNQGQNQENILGEGLGKAEVAAADQLCHTAYVARYGAISPSTYEKFLDCSAKADA